MWNFKNYKDELREAIAVLVSPTPTRYRRANRSYQYSNGDTITSYKWPFSTKTLKDDRWTGGE